MSKTIEELEGEVWSEPEYGSHVVTNSHRLRKKPIDQFTVEDLRFMIGQHIGTAYLVPLALDLLEQDPLVEDYHYPGELLHQIVHLPHEYWAAHSDHLARAIEVAELAIEEVARRCEEKREEARRLYGAELDDQECLEQSERDVRVWVASFLSRHRAV